MQQDINPLDAGVGTGTGQEYTDPFAIPRSPQWPRVEEAFLAGKSCAACTMQGQGLVQAHHIIPFQYCVYLKRPELEFHPKNLIALCEGQTTNDHHIAVGHLGDFQYLNQVVQQDVTGPWYGRNRVDIETLPDWLARERWPAKPLSPDECTRLLALMEQQCGPQPPESIDALIEMWWPSRKPGKGAVAADASGSVPAGNAGGDVQAPGATVG